MTPRSVSLALAAALALTVGLGPAFAQKKPKPQAGPVSISATPNPTVFSTPVTITGRVDKAGAGVTVTLQTRIAPATTYTTVTTARTENNGRYRFVHRPRRNVYYRVVASLSPPQNSSDLLVRVRTLVGFRVSDLTPAAGSRVRFSGIVRPRHDGRLAYVQRRAGDGRWVTVARTALRALDAQSSRYRVTLRVRRSGTYRARVLGHDDHAMGISRTRTVTVH